MSVFKTKKPLSRKQKYKLQIEELLKTIHKQDKVIKELEDSNRELLEEITKGRELMVLELAKKRNFKPIKYKKYIPFRVGEPYREVVDKEDKDGNRRIEIVEITPSSGGYEEEIIIDFEKEPKKYVDYLRKEIYKEHINPERSRHRSIFPVKLN